MTAPLGGLLGNLTQSQPGSFTTSLNPEQEAAYQVWLKVHGIKDADNPLAFYDYRGAFLEGVNPFLGHWPDTYKQPGHPTFSVESKYAFLRPELAGHWKGETYVPPKKK